MDVNIVTALIGVSAGAIGYWLSTFSVQPILRYRDFRSQVLKDFIYYAQVVNAERLNEEMQALYKERVLANRKTSAALTAAILELPCWYKWYLRTKGLSPEDGAMRLIGYSNTTDHETANRLSASIRSALGLPSET